MREIIEELRGLAGARLCEAAQGTALDVLAALNLPDEHREFLRQANGVSASHGFVRLFGAGCTGCPDLAWWNDRETWKFAWSSSLAEYVAFGETGWGDQFAYRLDALSRGDTTVFFFDSYEMQPEELAPGFASFMTHEFLRQARQPDDSMTRAAMARLGALAWNEHVTYVPSLLLGGEEDLANVQKINARASMILNGDLATQAEGAPDAVPASVQTYSDDQGRLRTRVVWRD